MNKRQLKALSDVDGKEHFKFKVKDFKNPEFTLRILKFMEKGFPIWEEEKYGGSHEIGPETILNKFAPKLRKNKDIVIQAVKTGYPYRSVPDEFREEDAIVEAAVIYHANQVLNENADDTIFDKELALKYLNQVNHSTIYIKNIALSLRLDDEIQNTVLEVYKQNARLMIGHLSDKDILSRLENHKATLTMWVEEALNNPKIVEKVEKNKELESKIEELTITSVSTKETTKSEVENGQN